MYSIKEDITIKATSQMPDGFSITCSMPVYDEKTLMVGNAVGSVYFYSLDERQFIKPALHYSDIVKSMAAILKLVKDPKSNPIFRPILKNVDSDSDYKVISLHSHNYIKTRLLIAYGNNLVVIYNFDKEVVEAVFDVASCYNSMFETQEPPLTVEHNPCVIKDAKYSIDSFKIMVALFSGKVLIFAHGKQNN